MPRSLGCSAPPPLPAGEADLLGAMDRLVRVISLALRASSPLAGFFLQPKLLSSLIAVGAREERMDWEDAAGETREYIHHVRGAGAAGAVSVTVTECGAHVVEVEGR